MDQISVNGQLFDFPVRGPEGPDCNPIGTVISFMGVNPPPDYLICDGASYKISEYPALANFFKQQFGSATFFGSDGEGTFAVPDMRNLFLRGYHGSSDDQLSDEIGKKQEATISPNISGSILSNRSLGIVTSVSEGVGSTDVINYDTKFNEYYNQFVGLVNNAVPYPSDRPSQYTSRPVNMAVLYCIKAVLNRSNTYTAEEQVIGTWIDGRPVYRRACEVTLYNQISTGGGTPLISTDGSVEIKKIYGFALTNDGAIFPIPLIDHNGVAKDVTNSIVPYYVRSDNIGKIYVRLYSSDGRFYSQPATIIIEYTRSTDEKV